MNETDSYHSSEPAFRLISLQRKALGDWGPTDTPAGGITLLVVPKVVLSVVSCIVRRVISTEVPR